MNTAFDQHRLVCHGGADSEHWSLLQRLTEPSSFKRDVWKPIQTQMTREQAQQRLDELNQPRSTFL